MGAGRRRRRRCWRGSRSPRRARASATTSRATGSTIGAASRHGTACRSRSRRTCRSTPAAPSRSSPPSAAHDPIDTLCDYLIEDSGATRVLVTSISEDDMREIVRSPTALVGSDGNCVATYGTVSQGMPHPRFYGTFPRIIGHYVRERGLLPLEAAIHKMTGATARALKLADRGLLQAGLSRRHRDLRSGRFQGPRHLCGPAPISERRAHHRASSTARRGRQRGPHRRPARQGAAPRRRRRVD